MGLFDRFKKQEKSARHLAHPRDLQMGDMLDFELMAQASLQAKSFQVNDIWTLDVGGDKSKRIYIQLKDIEQIIRLRVVDEDTLEVSREVDAETLLSLFPEQAIADILDADSGVNHRLQLQENIDNLPLELKGWLSSSYRQEGFVLAYRYEKDYRQQRLPEVSGLEEEGCDFAWLVSDDRQFSVEFRVFDGGRTEAHLCAMIPVRKVAGLWPAKQS